MIDGKNIGHLATLMRDGSPQVTPVWVDREGDSILVNTLEGRVKPTNVRRDKRVAISIHSQDNPYQMVTFRGKVVTITNDGAEAHVDKMMKKYTGQDKYAWGKPGDKRVIIKIEALHMNSQ
ncbi:MAG: PPOX class F420-dependent oxidoreductase [Candidatus Bathyarchaeia archaeon]